MSRDSPLIKIGSAGVFILLVVSLFTLAFAGGVSAQTTGEDGSDKWCLAASTVDGGSNADVENVCGPTSSASPHEKVKVKYVRSSTQFGDNVHTIVPIFKTDAREDVRIETTIEYAGHGDIYKVDARGNVEPTPVSNNEEFRTYQLSENDRRTDVFRYKFPEGSVSKNELKMSVNVYDESNTLVASLDGDSVMGVGGFFVTETEDPEVNSQSEEDEDQKNQGDGSGVINSNDSEVTIDERTSDISRYNDGLTEPRPLYDPSIPPTRYNNGNQVEWAIGESKNVESLREVETGSEYEEGAVITSEKHPNQSRQGIHFGTATYRIPQASQHYLNIDYALAVANTSDELEVEVVNAQGDKIDPNAPTRTLGHTMSDTINGEPVDFNSREQFEKAINDDLMNPASQTFELTAAETRYINSNYEAYVTYEVTGESGLVLFRSAFTSTDNSGTAISFSPINPEVNESIQFSTGITQGDSYTWTIGGETLSGQNVTYDGFSEPGQKTATLEVEASDGSVREYQRSVTVSPREFEDETSTFDISYEIDRPVNDRFGTVDIEPETEELRVPVTIKNDGDTTVEREVSLMDSLVREYGYEDREIDSKTVTVSPRSTKEVVLTGEWEGHEFGQHKVTVVDGTDEPVVQRSNSDNPETQVYVYQPATLSIDNLELPTTWLVENNFNGRVIVTNEGDLSTRHPASDNVVDSEYGDFWNGKVDQFDLAGGNVRAGEIGETREIVYDREELRYSPSYPEVTTSDRQSVNSPFGTEVGEHDFKAEALQTFMTPNQPLYKDHIDTMKQPVELYKMNILNLDMVTGGTAAQEVSDETWYASAFPYTQTHWTTSDDWEVNESDRFNHDKIQYEGVSEDSITTTGITNYNAPVRTDVSNQQDRLYAKVHIANEGGDYTANARVKVVSDQKVYYPEDFSEFTAPTNRPVVDGYNNKQAEYFGDDVFTSRVVGAATVDLEPYETKEVNVPIIIPNNQQNEGEHELRVTVRDGATDREDYIQQLPELEDSSSQGAIEGQFQETVDIKAWGDSVLMETQQDQNSVNQSCDPVGLGDCDNSQSEEFTFDARYKNWGGASIEQTIDAHYYHTGEPILDPSKHHLARASGGNVSEGAVGGDRYKYKRVLTSSDSLPGAITGPNYTSDHQSYWKQNVTQTLSPKDEFTWTFQNKFKRPGEYRVQLTQSRINSQTDQLQGYDHPADEIDYNKHVEVELMVWDIMDPVARWHPEDATGEEKSENHTDRNVDIGTEYLNDEYAGLSSTESTINSADVWEGGALRLDGQDRWEWSPQQAENNQVSSDNVGVQDYNWTINGSEPNRVENGGQAIHRFDGPSDRNAELTIWDYDEFVEGDGTQNSDSEQKEIVVQPDNQDPNVTMYDDINHQMTNNPGEYIWAGSPEDRSGYFSNMKWTVVGSDNAIGIEDGRWNIETGSNSIYQCRDFWIANLTGSTNDSQATSPQNYTSCADNSEYRGDEAVHSGNPNYEAIAEWHDESYGSESGETTVSRFTATDFAGNEEYDEEEIEVYVDDTDPDADLEVENADRSVNDWVWGANNSQNYDGEAVEWDACDSEDEGPMGGVGLHGDNRSSSSSEAYHAPTAFKFTAPPGTGATNCHFTSDPYTIPSGSSGYITSDLKTETVTVRDWYGNIDTANESIHVVKDNIDPDIDCDPYDCEDIDDDMDGEPAGSAESNYPESFENSADAEACVTFENSGYYGGVGLNTDSVSISGDSYDTTIKEQNEETIEVCIDASADPSASASASASEPGCDEPTNYDYDDEYDDESEDNSATVTVSDYHGNTVSETITAEAEADAYDSDKDSESSDSCEPVNPPSNDDDDGGWDDVGSDDDWDGSDTDSGGGWGI